MNLRQLEAFRAAYLAGSVSRAAEILHVSQPSVSRLIGDLEAATRLKLFVRTARGMEPTSEARLLFRVVERSFTGVAEIRAVADVIRTAKVGSISLGVIPAFAYSVMPDAVSRMYVKSAEVRFNVSIRTGRAIADEIATGRLDLGLISPIGDYPNVNTLFRTTTKNVCLVPKSHPLARAKEPIDILKLQEEEFISFDESFLPYIGADPEVLDLIRRRSRVSSHSAPALAALAQATGAITIVDPFTASFIQKLGRVVARPIKQDLRYVVALIGRSERALSLVEKMLVQIIEEEIWAKVGDA